MSEVVFCLKTFMEAKSIENNHKAVIDPDPFAIAIAITYTA